MQKNTKLQKSSLPIGKTVSLVVIAVLIGLVVWVLYGQSQPPSSSSINKVENAAGGSPSLVAFLEKDYTGCDKNGLQGVYRIVKEVPNFARLAYGCNRTDAFMIAERIRGRWMLISPTNQFTLSGIPSCSMINAHHVSAKLEPQCYTNLEPLELQQVTW